MYGSLASFFDDAWLRERCQCSPERLEVNSGGDGDADKFSEYGALIGSEGLATSAAEFDQTLFLVRLLVDIMNDLTLH